MSHVRLTHSGLNRTITVREEQVNGLEKSGWSRADNEVVTDPGRPADGAKKSEWVSYAESKGGDRATVSKMSQADIAAAYGG